MTACNDIVLFGVKSPLTVDYEETILRAGLTLTAAISVSTVVRLWRREKLIQLNELKDSMCSGGFIACAFSPSNRQQLCKLASDNGFIAYPRLVDPSAVISESARVGDGTFINAGSVVAGLSILGQHVVINRSTSVGHHCFIEDFASLGPGVTLAGNVRIGTGASIGAGATVLPDVRIGNNSIVAAGSVVRHNVNPNTVVAGNPARDIKIAPMSTVLGGNDQE